jgi:hypothetical protein
VKDAMQNLALKKIVLIMKEVVSAQQHLAHLNHLITTHVLDVVNMATLLQIAM